MKSTLVDLTLHIHVETDKAIKVSDDGDKLKAVWLPKSQIEFDKVTAQIYTVTMPEWLAMEKGLI